MRIPSSITRNTFVRSLACAAISVPFRGLATDMPVRYNPGEAPEDLKDALGGLKPGTGRPLNALIKMRAETGVERVAAEGTSPLFKPGQILDDLRTADSGVAQISFSFPDAWTLAGGPNLDVRDVKNSDSAFVLVRALPPRTKFDDLKSDFFLDLIFDPQGKYGAYGAVDDRKVTSSQLLSVNLPSGGQQSYRRLSLSFAPLTYNQNTVQRRALISATAVGGSVFVLVTGSLANRYKQLQPDLLAVQESFRAIGSNRPRVADEAL